MTQPDATNNVADNLPDENFYVWVTAHTPVGKFTGALGTQLLAEKDAKELVDALQSGQPTLMVLHEPPSFGSPEGQVTLSRAVLEHSVLVYKVLSKRLAE